MVVALGAVGCVDFSAEALRARQERCQQTCSGCCIPDGLCLAGTLSAACGFGGAACTACQPEAFCSEHVCVPSGVSEAGVSDAGVGDAGVGDAGVGDAGVGDAGVADAGVGDAGVGDAGVADAAVGDAGETTGGPLTVPNECVVIAPNELDFGAVQLGCVSAPVDIRIRNLCDSGTISPSIAMPDDGGFEFAAGVPMPTPLAAEAAYTVPVRFRPIRAGPATTTFVVSSDGGSFGVQTTFFGTGVAGALTTETYRVPTLVDVLLVVDDSGSMADKQRALGETASFFFSFALSNSVDWRLAVTTTDDNPSVQGHFRATDAGVRVLTASTGDYAGGFAAMVQAGTSGSFTERAFAAAVRALTPPLSSTVNSGFLRQGAGLAVVTLSDAPDQSPLDIDAYSDQLTRLHGWRARNAFSVSAFRPLAASAPTTCSYDGASPDPRTARIVDLTGGTSAEVCETSGTIGQMNYTKVGNAAFGARSVWFLKGSPSAANGISVSVNGNALPTTLWSYDSLRNAVVLSGGAPNPGGSISITYTLKCAP